MRDSAGLDMRRASKLKNTLERHSRCAGVRNLRSGMQEGKSSSQKVVAHLYLTISMPHMHIPRCSHSFLAVFMTS